MKGLIQKVLSFMNFLVTFGFICQPERKNRQTSTNRCTGSVVLDALNYLKKLCEEDSSSSNNQLL